MSLTWSNFMTLTGERKLQEVCEGGSKHKQGRRWDETRHDFRYVSSTRNCRTFHYQSVIWIFSTYQRPLFYMVDLEIQTRKVILWLVESYFILFVCRGWILILTSFVSFLLQTKNFAWSGLGFRHWLYIQIMQTLDTQVSISLFSMIGHYKYNGLICKYIAINFHLSNHSSAFGTRR